MRFPLIALNAFLALAMAAALIDGAGELSSGAVTTALLFLVIHLATVAFLIYEEWSE